jgi:predicted metal-dependent hydrolase
MSLKSNQNYQYGNTKINYTLVRSKRRKTSELIVDKDEITIRAPFDKSIFEIEKILDDKISWIIKKQKEYEYTPQEIFRPTFLPNSTIPYLGKNYKLKIVYDNKRKNSIEISDDSLLVILDNFEINTDSELLKDTIRYLYNKWLNQKAKEVFITKIKEYSKIIGVYPPQRIILKNLKNRWGSITKRNTMNLNRNLVKAPDDIIDYIVIHELCHLKIKGHSHHFWNFLKQYVPNYQKNIDWLNRNSESLIY